MEDFSEDDFQQFAESYIRTHVLDDTDNILLFKQDTSSLHIIMVCINYNMFINKQIGENTVLIVFEKPYVFTHIDTIYEKHNTVLIKPI